jgi:hypothetical protein
MTDESRHTNHPPEAPAASPGEGGSGAGRVSESHVWLTQLQHMIDRVATEAAPIAREIAVKAAELAAVAGDKAGPFARRAAEMTEDVGARVAVRSRRLAEDLRHRGAEEADAAPEAAAPPPGASGPAGASGEPREGEAAGS